MVSACDLSDEETAEIGLGDPFCIGVGAVGRQDHIELAMAFKFLFDHPL